MSVYRPPLASQQLYTPLLPSPGVPPYRSRSVDGGATYPSVDRSFLPASCQGLAASPAAAVAAAHVFVPACGNVLRGLRFGQGLCHHDFSPENVVISSGNAAVVMDFGMAQRMQISPAGDVVAQQDATPFGKLR